MAITEVNSIGIKDSQVKTDDIIIKTEALDIKCFT